MKIMAVNNNSRGVQMQKNFGVRLESNEIQKIISSSIPSDIKLQTGFLETLSMGNFVEELKKIKLLDGVEPTIIAKIDNNKTFVKAIVEGMDKVGINKDYDLAGVEFVYNKNMDAENNASEFVKIVQAACTQLENLPKYSEIILKKFADSFVKLVNG